MDTQMLYVVLLRYLVLASFHAPTMGKYIISSEAMRIRMIISRHLRTLRVWTLDGECVQELSGHTSFVYSVTVLSTGEFVSSSEDRSVRIWKGNLCNLHCYLYRRSSSSIIDGGCVQTLQQPCVSVWAVSHLPNDDILVGGSDSVVRVFTRADERMADADTQKVTFVDIWVYGNIHC